MYEKFLTLFFLQQKEFLQKTLRPIMASFCAITFLSACFSEPSDGNRRARASKFFRTVGLGEGRVFTANPIVLSNDPNLSPDSDLTVFFGAPQFITNSPTLTYNCEGRGGSGNFIQNCFRVREDEDISTLLFASKERWDYPKTADASFLQVNTFFHGKKSIERHNQILNHSYTQAGPIAPLYLTAIPHLLFTNGGHWYSDVFKSHLPLLEAFADCNINDNAFFDPAKFQLCFGSDSFTPNLKFAQDPSVIYHEFGHAFQQIVLNSRTSVSATPTIDERVSLGLLGYDEAGAIGEGLSDYWSYVLSVGNRTHFAEWSLGVNNKQSRPISEADSLHISGINDGPFSRLSYPEFLNYDANFPDTNTEDIHLAGQIVSHFLVALTEELKTVCQMNGEQEAVNNVMYLVTETLMEMGDLTSKGTDLGGNDRINLTSSHAKKWYEKMNPINFRTFFQTFAKYTWNIFGNGSGFSKCPLGPLGFYPQDNLETLLDSYGLLLFVNYNEDGNGSVSGHSGTNTQVNLANKSKTVLVTKDLIGLTTGPNTAKFLIFDDRQNIIDSIASLKSSGQIANISPLISNDLRFNNGNGRFSPGEISALSLVLFNDSNITMAGIQVLANNWDHTKTENGREKMCPHFEDNFPSALEGAADIAGETGAVPGECTYITRTYGDDGDKVSPICFVQVTENGNSIWASQDVLKKQMGLESHQCLGGTNGNNDECFVRVIKGADQAYFSKIDSQKTWAQSQQDGDGQSKSFAISNLIFFELGPQIPPTTKFVCRFRVRFSNCSDCYHNSDHDGDNFLDYEFSGGDPFKIINHTFTVTD